MTTDQFQFHIWGIHMIHDQQQAVSGRALVSNEASKSGGGIAPSRVTSAQSAIMAIQQKVGNQATARLLQRRMATQNNQPIQRMKDADFQKTFGTSMNITKRLALGPELMKFKKWLSGVLQGKTELNIEEYIAQDEFNLEMLEGYISQYKDFQKRVGPEVASNKKADVPIPQGMFLVASQSELEAGLYTDGVSPCVAVGFQIQTEEEDDVLALGHFDSFTSPALLTTMYNAALKKAGKTIQEVSHITISVAGGVSTPKHANSKELSGPELYTKLAELADELQAQASDKIDVVKRPSIDNLDINVRLDSAKGMERYKKSLVNPKMADQLVENPQALKATKFLLENGQFLTDSEGVPDQIGLDNVQDLKDSVKGAEEQLQQ